MKRLRELRKKRNLTMKELGALVGVSEASISFYETGKQAPSLKTANRLADVLGVSVDDLMDRAPENGYQNEGEEIPRTLEAKIVAKIMDKMTKEQREQLLAVIKIMFANEPDLFK